MSEPKRSQSGGNRVGLLVTCLIDMFRPNAGFAAASLLENAGYRVEVPVQGCCGQPNYNGGDEAGARGMALATIKLFADYDYVVVPSCSCAAMIRVHYPQLFAGAFAGDRDGNKDNAVAAQALADKTWELTSFLADVAKVATLNATLDANVVLHDSCSGLRELGVREQPRKLLRQVGGLKQQEIPNAEVCCGFGGTFGIKYPDISARLADNKIADIKTAETAEVLVSTDLGCLMHLGGKLHRDGSPMQTLHIAEVLAGMTGDTDAAEVSD